MDVLGHGSESSGCRNFDFCPPESRHFQVYGGQLSKLLQNTGLDSAPQLDISFTNSAVTGASFCHRDSCLYMLSLGPDRAVLAVCRVRRQLHETTAQIASCCLELHINCQVTFRTIFQTKVSSSLSNCFIRPNFPVLVVTWLCFGLTGIGDAPISAWA